MDKLTSLRAFVKVVELGSFSEAGRQLRLSRSAISKYVGELEASLGVQLLNRTTAHSVPHPEERPLGRVSKDGAKRPWFETRARARSSP